MYEERSRHHGEARQSAEHCVDHQNQQPCCKTNKRRKAARAAAGRRDRTGLPVPGPALMLVGSQVPCFLPESTALTQVGAGEAAAAPTRAARASQIWEIDRSYVCYFDALRFQTIGSSTIRHFRHSTCSVQRGIDHSHVQAGSQLLLWPSGLRVWRNRERAHRHCDTDGTSQHDGVRHATSSHEA